MNPATSAVTAAPLPAVADMALTDLLNQAARLCAEQQQPQAIALYRAWLAQTTSPLAFAAHFNLGVILGDLQDASGAEAEYLKAIAQNPGFIQGHVNLGLQQERLGRPDEALATWRHAMTLADPNNPDSRELLIQAMNNLGRLLELRHQFPEAEAILTQSLTLKPEQPDPLTHWVHLRQKQCKWPVCQPFNGITVRDMINATSALATLSMATDPAEQLAASRRFVEKKVLSGVAPLSDGRGYAHKKLRIGYMSGDFCAHAVSILTAELFELHDRNQIDLYGFCWSREDRTPMRARVRKALDNYIPLGELNDEQAAHIIRAHEIDILVDLQGLTSGTRPNILAYRPAPVQMTYIGFPGPTALPSIDYVIADRFVLPEELQPFFTEKPLYMPNSFQINDRQREIGVRPTRAANGLADDAFVFCSFNNNHKITPEFFGSWMRILARVPGSVLWMVADSPEVRHNLSAAAQAQGIDPERLVFAGRVLPADYIARFQIADLFLDTAPFNGGTTASDALWAGLPLLTCAGLTFSSRMAGSLLHAVDLPELITFNLQDYEDKAVSLANDRARIAAMKRQLVDNRLTCALFDSPRFVRDLEQRYHDVALRAPADSVAAPNAPAPVPVSAPAAAADPAPAPAPADETAAPFQLPVLGTLDEAQQSRVLSFMANTLMGLTDPERFHAIMGEATKLLAPGVFLGDGLLTWGRNNSMFDDGPFRQAWDANCRFEADRGAAWRLYMMACSAYHCVQLDGDFLACGLDNGTGIKTLIDYFGNKGFTKQFWGYDGSDDASADAVRHRLANYRQLRLVHGRLPLALAEGGPRQISYLHLNLANAQLEIDVLDRLFARVVAGGIVLLENYESGGALRAHKIAQDVWFERRQYRVFALPTGQGMVLKR